MSNNPKRYRDAETGEYVSATFAAANPKTTVMETEKNRDRWTILNRLYKQGGAIVRAADLSAEEVEQARADGRCFGTFVYLPIENLEVLHGGS